MPDYLRQAQRRARSQQLEPSSKRSRAPSFLSLPWNVPREAKKTIGIAQTARLSCSSSGMSGSRNVSTAAFDEGTLSAPWSIVT